EQPRPEPVPLAMERDQTGFGPDTVVDAGVPPVQPAIRVRPRAGPGLVPEQHLLADPVPAPLQVGRVRQPGRDQQRTQPPLPPHPCTLLAPSGCSPAFHFVITTATHRALYYRCFMVLGNDAVFQQETYLMMWKRLFPSARSQTVRRVARRVQLSVEA